MSTAFRVTFTGPAYQPLSSGAGTLADVAGANRSILIPLTVAVALFPALSLTEAEAPRLSPSPVMTLLGGHPPAGMSESASEHVHAIVTSLEYQPFALAAEVAAPAIEGAVLSMSIPLTPADAEFPAASVAVPLAD